MRNCFFSKGSAWVCSALLLAVLQSCGGSSNSITALPGSGSAPALQPGSSGVFTLPDPVSASAAGLVQIQIGSPEAPDQFAVEEVTFMALPISTRSGYRTYGARAEDALTPLPEITQITLPGVTAADIQVNTATTEGAGTSLIYQGNPDQVTFNDYVLVRALSDLPPNLRTPENIATRASQLLSDGTFVAEDLDPVPNQSNTDFVAGGSVPAPDLDDALVVYAATFLQPNQRTRENLAALVNTLAADANLDPEDITEIPGGELPGGVVINPSVTERAAGTFQISVQDPDLGTSEFSLGAAEFVQLIEIFPGFTSFGAESQSSLLTVAFDQIQIEGVDSNDCVIVHQPGQDPLIGSNQIARTGACDPAADVGGIRIAQFNASLNRNNEGDLVNDLSTPNNPQAQTVAEIIQRVNPDVLLVNEFDFVADGSAAELFRDNYLAVSQNGVPPVNYPFIYLAPSNTGVASGVDLDNNGVVGTTPGTFDYANDAFGFGFFPGQFAQVIYSKFPIDLPNVRTFQLFLWKDMPNSLLLDDPTDNPLTDFYSQEAIDIFRLSSKSHWDIPININGQIVHILASHPTPPVFDGPEDRNGKRNFDEIRFWRDYVTPGLGDYIYDDVEGPGNPSGGLAPGAKFVIMGDQNSDPNDGDSFPGAADQILGSPLTNTSLTPSSLGGIDAAARQGGANLGQISNPAFDTADFNDNPAPGNLRADYVLPSIDLNLLHAGVFWPPEGDPLFPLVGNFDPSFPNGFPSSDHRLVWIDVDL